MMLWSELSLTPIKHGNEMAPFTISFIANTARKKLEPNRNKPTIRLLGQWLSPMSEHHYYPGQTSRRISMSMVIYTHEPKFLDPVVAAANNVFDTTVDLIHASFSDTLTGHAQLADASMIFFEWLGRAAVEYCAENRIEGQKVVVRLHRFEINTPWPQKLDINRVDKVVVVSDFMRQQCIETYGWPENKVTRIYNACRIKGKGNNEKPMSASRTLGLLGYVPQIKRLDRAIDLLEILDEHDSGFRLKLKGQDPRQMPNLWKNEQERNYFEHQFSRIAAFPTGKVLIEDFDDQIEAWFDDVGWILSTSDFESFHLAPIEGLYAGAMPVVIDRRGAREIFPDEVLFTSIHGVANMILDTVEGERQYFASHLRKNEKIERYSWETGVLTWEKFLRGTLDEE
jgi:glycosyltransferase involved in cell wall biosynthesis